MMQFLLAILAGVLFDRLALPAVKTLVLVWTTMYTLAAPEHARTARREEIRSDLHEQISLMCHEGYRPSVIALDILCRMILGLRDDVTWSAPYLPSTLSERLSRGSDAVSRVRPSSFVIGLLAMLGLMNLSLYTTDRAVPLIEWAGMNAMIPVVGWVVFNQEHRWARRIVSLFLSLVVIFVVALILWLLLEFRLYQKPESYHLVLKVLLAMAPISVAIGVATRPVRGHLFKGRWWPVLVTWAMLGGTCVVAGEIVWGNPAIVLGLTFFAALMSVLFLGLLGIMVVIFGLAAKVVCLAGLRGTAVCMRLAAAGIRRLEQ